MARRPAAFKEVDVRRAIRAVEAAGISVGTVEFDLATGKIRLEVRGASDADSAKQVDAPKEWHF